MSGGNANTTISHPGEHWRLYWTSGLSNFQLDIVGFLAVLGESAVLANAQVSALSSLFYLPRLIPAPQALLYPTRPEKLPEKPGWVTGVQNGMSKGHVQHVAHILLGPANEMKPHEVRCVNISKRGNDMRTQKWTDRIFRGVKRVEVEDEEHKLPKPPPVARASNINKTPTMAPPLVKAKATGPLAAVTLLGTTISIILLIVSLVYGDGFSFVATLLLSFLTTLVGIVNKWKLNLAQMPKHSVVRQHKDENNVVIRYPNGSFLVVRCDEDVARELFFAPEEIKYNIKSNAAYRLISLLGTLMLMLGIVCLANARLQLQFAWGGAYIIINAAHWAAAAVPPSYHWDLSCYIMKEEGIEGGPYNQIFTEALWRAILLTKSKKWTGMAPPAAPQSAIWDKWLDKAVEQASAAKSHIGKLDRPLWPGEDTKKGDDPKGDIWETPNHWNAKAAWDELYNEARRTTGNANVLGNGNATGLTARNA